jgi:histidinol-phosphatase (PHP family)
MFDSHMHTPLCHHAVGAPLEYAHQAVHAGLAGICFTEHMPLPNDADKHVRLRQENLPTYYELIQNTQALCRDDLEIRCGLEMDFIPGIETFSQNLLAVYDWDYIIGSVHRVGELAYGTAPQPNDLENYWRAYYNLIIVAAQTGLYDAIGHLDLPVRWLKTPPHHFEMVLPVLDVIAKHKMALDFNTSGLRGELKAPHPPLEFLKAAFERGIPLVLGSDAHNPEDVGSHFTSAIEMAKQAGYTQMGAFKKRVLEMYSIINTDEG